MPEVARGARVRLELARDILKIKASVASSSKIAAKHQAASRIAAIRRVLLGRPGAGLLDALLSPSIGQAELQRIADEAMEIDTVDKLATSKYVGALVDGLSSLQRAEASNGVGGEQRISVSHAIGGLEMVDSMVDGHIGKGRLPDDIRQKLPALGELAAKADAANSEELLKEFAPDVFAHRSAVQAESERLNAEYRAKGDAYREVLNAIRRGEGGEGKSGAVDLEVKLEQAKEQYDTAYKAYADHHNEHLLDASNRVAQAIKNAKAKLQEPLVELGKAFTESVAQASPITPEQAEEWAQAQEVTPQAKARLKKIGYDLKQLRQDMAEFYRFTGGRVVKVKIHSKGDRRANATDIDAHGREGVINLDSRFDKLVLWHELAHHIEADPVARMAAGRLIKRRSVDGAIYSLRSLTGNPGYKSSEVAYKDGYFSPYVGKVYRDGMTEVFSMGVESFSNPLTLGRRLVQDAETLEFVAGYLKGEIHPLARAHMELRGRLIELQSGVEEESGNVVDNLKQKIAAAGPKYVADKDTNWLKETGLDWYVKGEQIGRFEGTDWYVFKAKVRNWDTRRKVNGIQLIRSLPNDMPGHRTWKLETREFASTDMTDVTVMVAISEKTGRNPYVSEIQNEDFLRKHLPA